MPHYKLAMLGFGNVGRSLARLLASKQADLQQEFDITFRITAIATGRHGVAIHPDGIDGEVAAALVESGSSLASLSAGPAPGDMLDFIRASGADVLFENTPVNYESGQPAAAHLETALQSGMHAITANKGPVVHAYHTLKALAQQQGKRFYFESSVMDGAPIFSLFRESLPAARLLGFRGVLNSTTNLILTRMETGEPFEDAVAYAQKIGIAETDPSGDIDGWDAAVKVAALATVLMDTPLKPHQVDRQGIRAITPAEIDRAKAAGKRWKLVCSARRTPQGITGRVAPEMVEVTSPLYGVEGTTSLVQFESDVLSLLTVVESDPGLHTTAYGLLADFLNAVRER